MAKEQYQPYDKSTKWLIQHHGDSILRLAQVDRIQAWRPAHAEVVQPRQLPDGLLEVRLEGEHRDDLFLLEVATYPERRAGEQLTRDLMLVYLDRGELPEPVTLVLRPKGKYRIPRVRQLRSRHGLSSCRMRWHVVELWTVPAERLLEAPDVGLVPWVPLADFAGPPEPVIRRCREAIDRRAPVAERANFLAVTQVLTRLRYNDVGLLSILGGKKIMIESPLIDEMFAERAAERVQRTILAFLEGRFGEITPELVEKVRSVTDEDRLTDLARKAGSCRDLDAFRKELQD